MKNNTDNEIFFHKIISVDNPSITPDPAVLHRLQYRLLLKNSHRQVKQNALLPFLGVMFTSHVGMKAGLATVILASILFVGKINDHQVNSAYTDSCALHSMMVDTNYMVKDSCR